MPERGVTRGAGLPARACLAVILLLYLVLGAVGFVGERHLAAVTGYFKQKHRARTASYRNPPEMTPDEMLARLDAAAALLPSAAVHYELAKIQHRLLLERSYEPGAALDTTAEKRAGGALSGYAASYVLNECNPRAHQWRGLLLRSLSRRRITAARLTPDRAAALSEMELEAAHTLEPAAPEVNFHLGLLRLGRGESKRAAALFRGSLRNSLAFLDDIANELLAREGGYDVLTKSVPVNEHALDRLHDLLFVRGMFSESFEQWSRMRTLAGQEVPDTGPGVGIVHNGGFEDPPGNHFHGWEAVPAPGVRVGRDSVDSRGGAYSLRIGFDEAGGNYYNLRQKVPVEPGKIYAITVWIRTEGLPAAGRPGVEVMHPKGYERFSVSAAVIENGDASDWRRATVRFTAPPDALHLVLRIRRFGGTEKITGAMWVDDVEMSEF